MAGRQAASFSLAHRDGLGAVATLTGNSANQPTEDGGCTAALSQRAIKSSKGFPAKASPASEELGNVAPPRDKAAALMPQLVTPSTAPLPRVFARGQLIVACVVVSTCESTASRGGDESRGS